MMTKAIFAGSPILRFLSGAGFSIFLLFLFAGDAAAANGPQIVYPSGVALDGAGNLFISDSGTQRILKLDPAGRLSIVAGTGETGFSGDGGPAVKARLSSPTDMVVDRGGNLYFADTYNHRIRKIDTAGTITTFAGTGRCGSAGDGGPALKAELNNPQSVALDAQGNLLIADTYNHSVRRIDRQGIITTIAGSSPGYAGDDGPALKALLANPTDVKAGPDGAIYVSDSLNMRIRRIGPDGRIVTFAGNGKEGIKGDGGPPLDAQIFISAGMAFDSAGSLYIAEGAGSRVRLVRNGKIETIAGNGSAGFGGDGGLAVKAQLNSPNKLVVDGQGNVYVADRANHRVRMIDTKGLIRTVAGEGAADGLLLSSRN